ncbi:hypothetical protein HaLaN_16768, partial [Haematococcus lacustris]
MSLVREATCIALNPGGDVVAVGCIDSRVLLMDAKSLAPMAGHDLSGNEVKAITAMQFRPDGQGGHDNVAVMAQVRDGAAAPHGAPSTLCTALQQCHLLPCVFYFFSEQPKPVRFPAPPAQQANTTSIQQSREAIGQALLHFTGYSARDVHDTLEVGHLMMLGLQRNCDDMQCRCGLSCTQWS